MLPTGKQHNDACEVAGHTDPGAQKAGMLQIYTGLSFLGGGTKAAGLSIPWYSGLGIMSMPMAMRLDILKKPTVSAKSKMSSWLSPTAVSAARSDSTTCSGVLVSFQ